MRVHAALAIAGLTVAGCATLPAASAGPDCDRACLAGKLDAYLDAVAAHDPAQAPLMSGVFRQTENAVVQPLGEGMWKTLDSWGALDRRYYDPVLGAAVFHGTITQAGQRAQAAVRIKVEGGLISEAEWFTSRASDAGIEGAPGEVLFDIDKLEADPPPERVVPPAERASRRQLAAAANSYFDGITSASRYIALANDGCRRFENGRLVTGGPLQPGREWDGSNGASDCRSGQGRFDVSNVAARRVHVIDEEAQVVVVSVVFIRSHDHAKRRNAFMDVMKLDGGRVSDIYATMEYVDPERAVPNWPPYDGNFAR